MNDVGKLQDKLTGQENVGSHEYTAGYSTKVPIAKVAIDYHLSLIIMLLSCYYRFVLIVFILWKLYIGKYSQQRE